VGQRLGSAAAISVLLLVVVAALSWLALKLSNPLKGDER
jgi:multiple sugar transport system permease protein